MAEHADGSFGSWEDPDPAQRIDLFRALDQLSRLDRAVLVLRNYEDLRSDRSAVIVQGRGDTFTVGELTTMATSRLWDLTVTPSADDQTAAEALQPFYDWV